MDLRDYTEVIDTEEIDSWIEPELAELREQALVNSDVGTLIATAYKTIASVLRAEPVGPVSPVGSLTVIPVFDGLAAPDSNIHGDVGIPSDVPYTGAINTDYLIQSGADIIAVVDVLLSLNASVAIIDQGVNNRNIYQVFIEVRDSGDVVQDVYQGTSTYIRDDNVAYDSGICAVNVPMLTLSAGDKLRVRVEVLDAQTASGTVNADETKSQLKLKLISMA